MQTHVGCEQRRCWSDGDREAINRRLVRLMFQSTSRPSASSWMVCRTLEDADRTSDSCTSAISNRAINGVCGCIRSAGYPAQSTALHAPCEHVQVEASSFRHSSVSGSRLRSTVLHLCAAGRPCPFNQQCGFPRLR